MSRKQQGLLSHGVAGIIGKLNSVVVASQSGLKAVTMLEVVNNAAQRGDDGQRCRLQSFLGKHPTNPTLFSPISVHTRRSIQRLVRVWGRSPEG